MAIPIRGLSATVAAGIRSSRGALRPVLLSWLVARVVVLAALVLAEQLPAAQRENLLGWDADWYRRIGNLGYQQLPREGVRFFPLLPLVARALSLGHDTGPALLLLANAGALAAGLLTHRLAVREGLHPTAAARAVWAVALAPAGYVLVMGYTEPLHLALLAGLLLGLRDRRWLLVAVLGAGSGLLRPTGVLVALPVLVEALAGLRAAPRADVVRRVVAVSAPAAGLGGYLAWSGVVLGNPLLPFAVQTRPGLRGGALVDPVPSVVQALQQPLSQWPAGPVLHAPGLVVALLLLVVVFRRLPRSHAVYTATGLVLALTSREVQSFDRYALSLLPLALAAGVVVESRRRAVLAAVAAVPLLFVSAFLAFHHVTVP